MARHITGRRHGEAGGGDRTFPVAGAVLLALLATGAPACAPREEPDVDARLSVAAALAAGDDAGYARALTVRDLAFPADHGPHPDFRTEWWYFTGNLVAEEAPESEAEPRRFGYQLTFFRTAVAPPRAGGPVRDGASGEATPDGPASGTGPGEPAAGRRPGHGAAGARPGATARGPAGRGEASDGDTPAGPASGLPGEAGATPPASDWRTRQVYMAHFAVTDVAGGRFHAAQRFARGAAGLAGAVADPFRVWTGGWQAYREPAPGGDDRPPVAPDREGTRPARSGTAADAAADGRADGLFPLRLVAADGDGGGGGFAVDLLLEAGKGRVLQGELGLSQKGQEPGNASYYYTYPRMPTLGTVTVDGTTFRVEGASWLDREWSTSILGEGKAGWDWFAVQLDDGRDVVAFRLRDAAEAKAPEEGPDGGPRPLDYAALVPADPDQAGPGRLRVLDATAGSLEVTRRWTSPDSGVTYPAGWRLRLPDAGLDLELRPRLDDQELDLAFRYWEGSVAVTGSAGGRPVTGQGYAELTGYGDAAPRTR